jgi:choline kinase
MAPDDMLVRLSGERVCAVGKDLSPLLAHHRSLGFVAWSGEGASTYRDAVQAVLGQSDGTQAFHHAVVDRLARDGAVHAVLFEGGVWTEIDRPEDIAAWGESPERRADSQLRLASGD